MTTAADANTENMETNLHAKTILHELGEELVTVLGAREFVAQSEGPGILGGLRFALGAGFCTPSGQSAACVLVTFGPSGTYHVHVFGHVRADGRRPLLCDVEDVSDLRSNLAALLGAHL